MTWRERTVVAILLLVARMLCENSSLRSEIANIATSIGVEARKDQAA